MRRIIALLLVAMMAVAVAACDNSNVLGFGQTQAKFQVGAISGNTYSNPFLGVSCTTDDDWTYYTADETAELNNLAAGYLPEDYAKIYETTDTFVDMCVVSDDGSCNINVSAEKLTALQSKTFDAETTFRSNFATYKETYENMGYTNCEFDIQKVVVDGKEFDGCCCTANLEGLTLHQKQIAFVKNNYAVMVTVTSFNSDLFNELFEFISFI